MRFSMNPKVFNIISLVTTFPTGVLLGHSRVLLFSLRFFFFVASTSLLMILQLIFSVKSSTAGCTLKWLDISMKQHMSGHVMFQCFNTTQRTGNSLISTESALLRWILSSGFSFTSSRFLGYKISALLVLCIFSLVCIFMPTQCLLVVENSLTLGA